MYTRVYILILLKNNSARPFRNLFFPSEAAITRRCASLLWWLKNNVIFHGAPPLSQPTLAPRGGCAFVLRHKNRDLSAAGSVYWPLRSPSLALNRARVHVICTYNIFVYTRGAALSLLQHVFFSRAQSLTRHLTTFTNTCQNWLVSCESIEVYAT
jgi:hypothetical protein